MLDVRLFDVAEAGEAEWDDYHEMRLAAYERDFPELPAPTRAATISGLRAPQVQLGERLLWTARRDGRLVGRAHVSLPADGNEHLAALDVVVHPELRRQGIGTELLNFVAPLLRERGRTVVEGWNVNLDGDSGHWIRRHGFRLVHSTLLQIMELSGLDRARWEVDVPEGYRLVRWIGHAPDDLVDAYAVARRAIGDAPTGESALTAPDWTVDRVRRIEADYHEHGIEHRTVVAVDARGEVAGLTELEARPTDRRRLIQGDTVVLGAHRGHGLGLAMKADMLRWITADKDDLEQVWTSTGVANTHMADVNHRLGFATVRRYSVVNRDLEGL
ncbi:GNAT family N-acetyltransferase [Kutzneria sp. NPDC051319]|uniref:GNAT family N-acetyltransferase n=1 Tax=Kutzneria sp. NPDC051319 TaxID=3155047 RepID=UPI0034202BBD